MTIIYCPHELQIASVRSFEVAELFPLSSAILPHRQVRQFRMNTGHLRLPATELVSCALVISNIGSVGLVRHVVIPQFPSHGFLST